MARSGLGAPARLQLPPPRARGGARPSLARPAHPARERDGEERVPEKLKGSPSGRLASKARHRTPTAGRNRRSRTPVSPPFQLGGGRRKKGARARRSRGRWHGLSSRRAHRLRPRRPRRPPLQLPNAEQPSRPDGSEAGARPGPARRPLRPFHPRAASSRPQPPLGPRRRGAGRLRRVGALQLQRGSHLRSRPRPRRGAHQPWGAGRAAWPPSHGLG